MNMIEAIKYGNLERVKDILTGNPIAIDMRDEASDVWAPFVAAECGEFEIVKYIVEYSRASMNTVDHLNRNILHYAVKSDKVDLVRYLVEYVGMDPCSCSKLGETPIDIAASSESKAVLWYFRNELGLKKEVMYRNPIIPGTHPDPSIVRVGEDYYMVNSSFTFFPCIPISHSKDLVNWRIIGHAVTEPGYLNLDEMEDGRAIWAPDISYHNGRFYIVATYRLNDGGPIYRKQMVVSSDKPEGPYSKPVFIEEDGIDPSVFADDDGRRYMLLNRGARIFEVSEDCTMKLSEAKMLWYGDNKRAPEGPHLLKKDGYYYLFVAEGGTGIGHCISVARSKHLMGPYESCPYNPIMTQRKPMEYIQRAGHGKPVQTQNGEWYMIYLCGRPMGEGYCILGRETSMDPITWTKDGWPLINNGRGPSVLQHRPQLPEHVWECTLKDDFESDKLGHDWVFMRHPEEKGYYLSDGKLNLLSSPKDLCYMDAKNFVLRRQKSHEFTAETKITIDINRIGQEIGMTGYYDTLTYLKFGILYTEEGAKLRIVERVGEEERHHFDTILDSVSEIYLKMETKLFERSFYYSYDGRNWLLLGKLTNIYYLSDEGIDKGKRFTGTMVGLYVIEENSEKRTYGKFHYFYYK